MFTGIVEELGEITALDRRDEDARLGVRGALVSSDAQVGDSIAVNGVCLTVTDVTPDGGFTADVMLETLRRSSLGALQVGSRVNLERPLTLAARLGGHLVQGHVDGTGTVLERTPTERWELVRISLPADLARYVVEKGSIAVDGISLTVVAVTDPRPVPGAAASGAKPVPGGAMSADFTVSLIPTTLARTTLGGKGPGDPVNLEVDVLAKYAEKLLAARTETA